MGETFYVLIIGNSSVLFSNLILHVRAVRLTIGHRSHIVSKILITVKNNENRSTACCFEFIKTPNMNLPISH